MADEIGRLTELLARDPSNAAFLRLADMLRARGDLDAALKVAVRGLERHSLDAEAHALLARICIDRGELQRAFDEWDMALRLSPGHAGALKGLGFITYRWGRLDDAERYLADALAGTPDDVSLGGALRSVREARASLQSFADAPTDTRPQAAPARPKQAPDTRPGGPAAQIAVPVQSPETGIAARVPSFIEPHDDEATPKLLFKQVIAGTDVQAMLVDSDGLVVAGDFTGADGASRGQDMGAKLTGVCDEADRAMRHLELGDWKSITFEAPGTVIAMAQASEDALVVVGSAGGTPLGLLRKVLERAQRTANAWLEGSS